MTTSKKLALISTVAILGLIAIAQPNAAHASDVTADFSGTSNPNGVWSYGSSWTIGGSFVLDTIKTNSVDGIGLTGWLANPSVGGADGSPYVAYNGTAGPITNNHNTVYQPGQLAIVPGFTNDYAVVRYTAPSAGTFNIASTFSGLSTLGDDVNVYILTNGVPMFSSSVVGSPDPASFSGTRTLALGETVDFVVATAIPDGVNYETTTLFSATVTTVPEPGVLGLVVASFGCLLSFRFMKRK